MFILLPAFSEVAKTRLFISNKGLLCLFLPFLLCCSRNSESGSLTMCFTGDVLLDRGVRKIIERVGIDSVFSGVKPLFQSCDAVVINLENPVTKRVSPLNKKYVFRAEPEWLPALRKHGITHAAMANNHTIDQGREGIADTYRNLRKSNIIPIGYGNNQQGACKPSLVEKNGVKVALFNSFLLRVEGWEFLENEKGICQASAEQLSNSIKTFKKTNPNYWVVAILHWGEEYQKEPSKRQRKEAYLLVDSGADAIIGHHPHVIQDKEIYKGKPIFYSLGNFVFDQKESDRSSGLVVSLSFSILPMCLE